MRNRFANKWIAIPNHPTFDYLILIVVQYQAAVCELVYVVFGCVAAQLDNTVEQIRK
jgi:hypothetical protein